MTWSEPNGRIQVTIKMNDDVEVQERQKGVLTIQTDAYNIVIS